MKYLLYNVPIQKKKLPDYQNEKTDRCPTNSTPLSDCSNFDY